ncbi:thiamine diphosphokinase [Gracilibacillus marinus]|uniref:Thiamine diphosphokinase n=1 Tax=Gracilibacillus marinus TaxID=630535 RepID=A0ABV8VTV9_9BACI
MNIAIVAGGTIHSLDLLHNYHRQIDVWIGADRGAFVILEANIELDYAVGDFDSVSETEREEISHKAKKMFTFPKEKDETDLDLAVKLALENNPSQLYFFGVTGGRLDHELVNIQLLYRLLCMNISGIIVNEQNEVTMYLQGDYRVDKGDHYISFIPFSNQVKGLTLDGFQYPLINQTIEWGSTLCISNKIIGKFGTFSFTEGILIMIKSVE